MDSSNILLIIIPLLILIFSAILHEIAHGYVADRLGDPTARLLGRLTLNPLAHIDLFMSIIIPLMLIISKSPIIFGGAKPVPVDPFNLQDGRKDLALVSLAGPLTNLTLAVVASLILHAISPTNHLPTIMYSSIPGFILGNIVFLNVMLALFNLLPIPPLDGSKLFALLLPEKEAKAYLSIGEIGTFILFFLLVVPIGPFSLQDVISTLYTSALSLLRFSLN